MHPTEEFEPHSLDRCSLLFPAQRGSSHLDALVGTVTGHAGLRRWTDCLC